MVALLIVPFAFLVLLAATVVLGGSVGAAEHDSQCRHCRHRNGRRRGHGCAHGAPRCD